LLPAPTSPLSLPYTTLFRSPSGKVTELGFTAVQDLANRLANVLVAHGLSRGDRVAILLPQRRETAVAHVAVYKAGLVAVPLFKLDRKSTRLNSSHGSISYAV